MVLEKWSEVRAASEKKQDRVFLLSQLSHKWIAFLIRTVLLVSLLFELICLYLLKVKIKNMSGVVGFCFFLSFFILILH